MRADMTYKDCRTKRQRRAWNYGMLEGKKQAENTTEAIQARTAHFQLQFDLAAHDRLAFEKSQLDIRVQQLERELAFASDRIEQLIHNASAIPKDKK